MNWRKTLTYMIVGCALGLFFCCGGSKQLSSGENTEVKKEVNYIPYYLKVYEADSLYWTNNHNESYIILDSLFNQYKPINLLDEINQYLVSSYLTNKFNGKDKYIELIFKEWGFIKEDFDTYPEIELLCKELNIDDLTMNEWENFYINCKVDYELRKQVEALVDLDQLYRKKNNQDLSKLDSIDKLIQPQIINILEKYGYPNRKMGLGILRLKGEEYKFLEIQTILKHTNDSLRENYLFEKLLSEVKKGNVLPIVYGSVVDQYFVYNDEPQLYGTMYRIYPDELVKLKYNITETKKIRKEYGMYPNPLYQVWRNNQIDIEYSEFNH